MGAQSDAGTFTLPILVACHHLFPPAVRPQGEVEPNPVACSALMNACDKGRQWQQALALLDQMPQLRVPWCQVAFGG